MLCTCSCFKGSTGLASPRGTGDGPILQVGACPQNLECVCVRVRAS
jgi:hypothetical protein